MTARTSSAHQKRRAAALASGNPRYTGAPCKACGNKERYAKHNKCCHCSAVNQRYQGHRRIEAIPKQERIYPNLVGWLQKEPWRLVAGR